MNNVIPLSREFLTQYNNGPNFSLNLTNVSSFFVSNILEKNKLIATYLIFTLTESTDVAPITIDSFFSNYELLLETTTWAEEGFVVGNAIHITANGATTTGTVVSAEGNQLVFSGTDPMVALDVEAGAPRSDFEIRVTTQPTSLIFKFGIIPNELAATSFASILDGQQQSYSKNGVPETLNYLSSESSNLGSVLYRFDGVGGTANSEFTFTVEHIFRMPHFIDGWLTDYQTGIVPSVFAGTNSYRYLSQLNFGNNISNPDDGKVFNDGFKKGSVGFANQNFNAGATVYNLQSVSYDIAGDSVEAPEITATTTVTAVIKKTDGNFTAGVQAYLYHTKLANSLFYQENDNTFDDNFVIDQVSQVDGGGAVAADIINGYTATIDGGDASLLNITFDLTYSTDKQAQFNNLDWLGLIVGVADAALTAEVSDRTPVKLDAVQVTKSADIPGLITDNQLDFNVRGSTLDYSNHDTWINQVIECNFNFKLTKFPSVGGVLNRDASINSMAALVIAKNPTTGDSFELSKFPFPITGVTFFENNIDSTIYQVTNLDTTRFLSVPETDALREVQLTMAAPVTFEATQLVTGKFGFIIPWRQWEQNLDASDDVEAATAFYDGALPSEFFNLNFRSSNYSDLEGYDIYVRLVVGVTFEDENTNYNLESDAFKIADFDVDAAGSGWATDSITIFDPDGEETAEIIATGTNTVQAVLSNPDVGSITPQSLRAQIVTEETNNLGRHWRLHSDLIWSEDLNRLLPAIGETGVKIIYDAIGDTVTLECQLDGAKFSEFNTHSLYFFLND